MLNLKQYKIKQLRTYKVKWSIDWNSYIYIYITESLNIAQFKWYNNIIHKGDTVFVAYIRLPTQKKLLWLSDRKEDRLIDRYHDISYEVEENI